MDTASHYLHELAQATHRPEDELMAAAFRVGLQQLWRELTLDRYLRGDVSRTQAIADAGIDWVELADRQRQAVQADLEWAAKG